MGSCWQKGLQRGTLREARAALCQTQMVQARSNPPTTGHSELWTPHRKRIQERVKNTLQREDGTKNVENNLADTKVREGGE